MSAEATDTGGTGDSPPEIQNVAVADTNVLTNHLKHVVSVLLEGEDQPSPNLKSCLDSKEYQESLRKFISDPQTRALFIQRQSMKGAGFINFLFYYPQSEDLWYDVISLKILLFPFHRTPIAYNI